MKLLSIVATVVAVISSLGVAHAEDSKACPADMVCASNPNSVMQGLMAAGFSPSLTRDEDGDPNISVDADLKFTVYFYGCKDAQNCDSLRFVVAFNPQAGLDQSTANLWNKNKRFLQMSLRDDGSLFAAWDIATIGGLNKTNFADVCDWWSTMLGELSTFFVDTTRTGK